MKASSNPQTEWGPAAKLFHWSTAILILIMIALGWLAVAYPLSPTKITLFTWHKSLGLVVLAWVVIRLAWRLTHPAPALPAGMSRSGQRTARLAHGSLYALMLLMPASGLVINGAADFPLKWFGLFIVPPVVAPDQGLQEAAETVHYILFWTLMIVVALHAGAAFHHHFVRKDDLLRRMLPHIGKRHQ